MKGSLVQVVTLKNHMMTSFGHLSHLQDLGIKVQDGQVTNIYPL